MSRQQQQAYQRRFREIKNLKLFEEYSQCSPEPEPVESLSRIEHKDISSSSDESQEIGLPGLAGQDALYPPESFRPPQVDLLGGTPHQNNQSLNIETANSVADNISLQIANKSFPNLNRRLDASKLLPGSKQSPPQAGEIDSLNLRIDYYEQRKQDLEQMIQNEIHLKNQRFSQKDLSASKLGLKDPKPQVPVKKPDSTGNNDHSFQKRDNADTFSLIEKPSKPGDFTEKSLLGDLMCQPLQDPFTDTFHLKCTLVCNAQPTETSSSCWKRPTTRPSPRYTVCSRRGRLRKNRRQARSSMRPQTTFRGKST